MRFFVMALAVWVYSTNASELAAQEQSDHDSAKAVSDSARKRVFMLPPILVTATVVPVRQDKIGFASTVVTGEDIAGAVPSAGDALRRLPDVFIDEGAGTGGPAYDPTHAIMCYVAGDNLLDTYYETGFDRRGVPLRMRAGMRITS